MNRAWIDAWDHDVVAIVGTWLWDGHDWQLNVLRFDVSNGIERETKDGKVALIIRETVMATLGEDILQGCSAEAVWVEIRNDRNSSTLQRLNCKSPMACGKWRNRYVAKLPKDGKATGLF